MSSKKQINLGGIGPKPPEAYTPGDIFDAPPNVAVRVRLADNWDKTLNDQQRCETCMYYVNFRCRRHAPKGQEGWPAVYPTDWCGDHKMNKRTMAERA